MNEDIFKIKKIYYIYKSKAIKSNSNSKLIM